MILKTLIVLLAGTLLLTACLDKPTDAVVQNPATKDIDSLPFQHRPDTISYTEVKSQIDKIRTGLARKNLSTDSLSTLFTDLLVSRIIPYWYGTSWSFEGHTTVPGQGTIACGYFVSTTLTDMGLNINRFKLAQQWPEDEALSLALNRPLLTVTDTTPEGIIIQLRDRLHDGVYFAGLDQSHVGYLLKWKGGLFFIHSNYYMSKGVEMERADKSPVFGAFRQIFVAPISTNEMLLKYWLDGTQLEIIVH